MIITDRGTTLRRWLVSIGVATLLVTFLILFYKSDSNSKVVEIVSVQEGEIIDFITTTGRIEAVEEAIVRARGKGKIDKVFVEEGEDVKIGEELVEFDLIEERDAVKRAKLKVEEADIQIQEARIRLEASERTYSDPSEIELNLKAKERHHRQALIDRDSAEREYKVYKELYRLQVESLIDLKTKEDSLKKAEIRLLQAKEELEEARQNFAKREKTRINLSSLKTEYEIAIRKKGLADAELELAISQLSRLKTTSPIDGIVVLKEVKDGMAVSAGQTLMTIADITQLQVRAEVDEIDAGRIRDGQEATVTFDAFPDREFHGVVTMVAPQAHTQGERTVVEVVIVIDRPVTLLKIGNQVDIKILIEKRGSVPSLPLSAVHHGKSPFVWVYQDGIVHKVEIQTGLSDLNSIEIVSGVSEGERVIINAGIELSDGERVKIE